MVRYQTTSTSASAETSESSGSNFKQGTVDTMKGIERSSDIVGQRPHGWIALASLLALVEILKRYARSLCGSLFPFNHCSRFRGCFMIGKPKFLPVVRNQCIRVRLRGLVPSGTALELRVCLPDITQV